MTQSLSFPSSSVHLPFIVPPYLCLSTFPLESQPALHSIYGYVIHLEIQPSPCPKKGILAESHPLRDGEIQPNL